MAQEMVAYIDGEFLPDSEAKISIHDAGFTHGDAVFDRTPSGTCDSSPASPSRSGPT